jgi:O-antigen/teichoic acid export membrane protein
LTNIRRALLLSFASEYSVTIIGLVSSIIIARLLTPEEIGLFSVGAAAVAIAHTLRDFGVPTYIVQEAELTYRRLQTAYTLMLAAGWTLGIILLASAQFIGSFYGSESVANVVMLLAINFFLLPFGTVTQALLRRELNYRTIYGLNVLEVTSSLIVAVIMAVMGFSYISLAVASVTATSMRVLACIFIRSESVFIRPGFFEVPRVFAISRQVSIAFILQEIGRNGTELIVGRILGFANAGFLSRANAVANLADTVITTAVRGVAFPYFAERKRANQELGSIYIKGLTYLLVTTWPVLALVGITAGQIIDVLFGSQWQPAVPVAQILVIAVALATVSKYSVSILLGCGASAKVVKIATIVQPIKLIFVLIFAVSGLKAVGYALILSEVVSVSITLRETCRIVKADMQQLAVEVIKSFFVSAATAASAYVGFVNATELQEDNIVILIMTGLAALLGWVLSILVVKHPILLEIKQSFNRRNR